MEELAKILRAASGASPIRLEAPAGVLYNVTEQEEAAAGSSCTFSTTLWRRYDLKLEVAGTYRAGRAVSPDDSGSFTISSGFGSKSATIQIPRIPDLQRLCSTGKLPNSEDITKSIRILALVTYTRFSNTGIPIASTMRFDLWTTSASSAFVFWKWKA